ncbi:hypothetical protein M3Y99_01078500 [Aphelenchoides fujianensis]|nr:hypothetical protein M3Y99_01078500 [Aphelenchoides fujianensis]
MEDLRSSTFSRSRYVPKKIDRPPSSNSGECQHLRESRVRFADEVQSFSPKRSNGLGGSSGGRRNALQRSKSDRLNDSRAAGRSWLDKTFGGNRSKSLLVEAHVQMAEVSFTSSKGPIKGCLKNSKPPRP